MIKIKPKVHIIKCEASGNSTHYINRCLLSSKVILAVTVLFPCFFITLESKLPMSRVLTVEVESGITDSCTITFPLNVYIPVKYPGN